ncbi:MAG: DUF202 domain-containing protein [Propionibacteriales bacterium]|nr:DUF202 domain-containing protein [Propionibacteriales bacterium]
MLVPALILVVGIAVIVYGGLRDRARAAARARALEQPPTTPIPGLRADAPAPSYLHGEAARTRPSGAPPTDLSETERTDLRGALDPAQALAAGWARQGFVTDTNSALAVLDDPSVLVTPTVASVRELLGTLQRASTTRRPLVIIANEVSSAVLDMVEVNVIQQRFSALVIVGADHDQRAAVAARTGASEVDRIDLQAGYVPEATLGRCGRWVSSDRHSWVLGTDPAQRTSRPACGGHPSQYDGAVDQDKGDDRDRRWPRSVYRVGQEPDVRFSFANERTFLAWIRTGLAFLTAGVAIYALSGIQPSLEAEARIAAVILVLCGVGCGMSSLWRWASAERALRAGRPLPSSVMTPVLVVVLVVVAAIAMIIVWP